ncbi:hypothetical protein GLO73106DRAFT_00028180 [Gloeocapsa sp. PCC 73106]|nr:hypothetical protein GLO73106DRAFT_00028180 [Gloeocapsa sp. PCC 73106]
MNQTLPLFWWSLKNNVYLLMYQIFWQYSLGELLIKSLSEYSEISQKEIGRELVSYYWQDNAWESIIKVWYSLLEEADAIDLLEFLLNIKSPEKHQFSNVFIGAEIVKELQKNEKTLPIIIQLQQALLDLINYELEYDYEPYLDYQATNLVKKIQTKAILALGCLVSLFPDNLNLLKNYGYHNKNWHLRQAAIQAVVLNLDYQKQTDGETNLFTWLKERAQNDEDPEVRKTALEAIARHLNSYPEARQLLRYCALTDEDPYVQQTAIRALAQVWRNHQETRTWLKNLAQSAHDSYLREAVVLEIAGAWDKDEQTLLTMKYLAQDEEDAYVRGIALQAIVKKWPTDPDTLPLLRHRAFLDADGYVRSIALQALAKGWGHQPQVVIWLKELAFFDQDEYVRSIAVQELSRHWKDKQDILSFLQEIVKLEENQYVRGIAIQELAKEWKQYSGILSMLQELSETDEDVAIRRTATQAIAREWKKDPTIFLWLQQRVICESDLEVKIVALQSMIQYGEENPALLPWLKRLILTDSVSDIRVIALKELAKRVKNDPEILIWLQQIATQDQYGYVRSIALQELTKAWLEQTSVPNYELLEFLQERVLTDPFERQYPFEYNPRQIALELIIKYYPSEPQTISLLENRVTQDQDEEVKSLAQEELALLKLNQ